MGKRGDQDLFFEIILAVFLGLIFGIITGLLPGIHPNTVVVGLLAISPFLLSFTSPIIIAIFITVVATVNTFTDAIPSTYLGAPEESTALGILPMHRFLLQGRGHEAILLTVIGGLFALILGLIITAPLLLVIKAIFPFLQKTIIYILIASVLFLIIREKKSRILALIVFLLSGILGMITLNLPSLPQPLFPLFSGMFGISTLLLSLNAKTKIPKQILTSPSITKKDLIKTTPISVFSGGLVSTLPALGSSQAAIIGSAFLKNTEMKNFLMMIGGINTVNFVLSFISLYTIDKARNGAVVAISQIMGAITLSHFLLFLSAAMVGAGFAAIATVYLSKVFSRVIVRVNYKALIISIISFVTLLVIIISGFYGFIIVVTGTAIGMIPSLKGIGKNHLMGSLMLPIILFYLI